MDTEPLPTPPKPDEWPERDDATFTSPQQMQQSTNATKQPGASTSPTRQFKDWADI